MDRSIHVVLIDTAAFSAMSSRQHSPCNVLSTTISCKKHQLSSDHWSWAALSAVNTWVGDRSKTPRVVGTICSFFSLFNFCFQFSSIFYGHKNRNENFKSIWCYGPVSAACRTLDLLGANFISTGFLSDTKLRPFDCIWLSWKIITTTWRIICDFGVWINVFSRFRLRFFRPFSRNWNFCRTT